MGPRYLPGLDGRPSGERHRRDRAQGHEKAKQPILHLISLDYQGLTLFSGNTLATPYGPFVPDEHEKPT